MRRLLLIALLPACTPEIGPGTYYCGPERLCPPDLVCDENLFTCVRDVQAEPFACPEGSEVGEPDGTLAEAEAGGALACGDGLVIHAGCLAAGDDVDTLAFDLPAACTGTDPHLSVVVRFPVALVPLQIELVDSAGGVMAAGEDCTPEENYTGKRHLCIEQPLSPGSYYLRVTVDPEGADCGGDCRYNSYSLDVLYPLA